VIDRLGQCGVKSAHFNQICNFAADHIFENLNLWQGKARHGMDAEWP
jgi:hypothetical protein